MTAKLSVDGSEYCSAMLAGAFGVLLTDSSCMLTAEAIRFCVNPLAKQIDSTRGASQDVLRSRCDVRIVVPSSREQLEILESVVCPVSVAVVDHVAVGDKSVDLLPRVPTLVDFAPTRVRGDVSVRGRPPAKTFAPRESFERLVHV